MASGTGEGTPGRRPLSVGSRLIFASPLKEAKGLNILLSPDSARQHLAPPSPHPPGPVSD